MESYGDLHLHSFYSDGSGAPENLVRYGAGRRLSFLALTDHDTMAGVERARIAGDTLGIQVIPGAEWSCFDGKRGKKVHLLSYFLKETPKVKALSHRILRARSNANREAFSKLKTLYPVTEEMLPPIMGESTALYKQHIMRLLMDMGYTGQIYSPLYKELFSSHGGSCFVPGEYPDIRDVLPIIKEAGGVCVIAHPMLYGNFPLVEELTEKGLLDGVEAWHPSHRTEDTAMLKEYSAVHGLAATGGTDFHGMHRKESMPIGSCFTTKPQFLCLNQKIRPCFGEKPTCVKP